MTESSGVFTFPSTGYWLVTFTISFQNVNGNQRANLGVIQVSTDSGSNFYDASSANQHGHTYTYGTYSSATTNKLLDVTNTSTFQVKFIGYDAGDGGIVYGLTNSNETCMTFMKLADT
jgi:hypothetical protein